MNWDPSSITGFASTVLGAGGLGGILGYFATRNRDNRSADAKLIETNLTLVNALLGRIDALEKAAIAQDLACDQKLEKMRIELNTLRTEIISLTIKLGKYERETK